MSRGDHMFRLRIPAHLHEQVSVQARRNLRTINSELVSLIAGALGVEATIGEPRPVRKPRGGADAR